MNEMLESGLGRFNDPPCDTAKIRADLLTQSMP